MSFFYFFFNLDESQPNLLGSHLKLIRKSYSLLGKELAYIMNSTFRNYQRYEAGDSEPSAYRLSRLSLYTGVSMEWLMGISSIPYTEEFISEIENSMWSKDENGNLQITKRVKMEDKYFDAKIFPFDDDLIFPEYADIDKRKQFYSLAARSSIIVLLNRYISLIDSSPCFAINVFGEFDFIHTTIEKDPIVKSLREYGIGVPYKALNPGTEIYQKPDKNKKAIVKPIYPDKYQEMLASYRAPIHGLDKAKNTEQ